MVFACKTDIGKKRKSNQDSYAVGELPGNAGWAVVCDGMGGANGGNIASSLAVKTISEQISSSWREGMSGKSINNLLQSALAAANINIYDQSASSRELSGMGTTVVAVIISDDIAYVAHAGDSRGYLISPDIITQLTTDHSLVQSMIESGTITEEEARSHPNKNVITKALGIDEEIEPEFSEFELEKDDYILICTDGLTGYVEPEEFNSIIRNTDYSDCPQVLVDTANKNGGGDNITVVQIAR